MAQRLARKLWPRTASARTTCPKEALLEEGFSEDDIDSGLTVYKPVGCPQCTKGLQGPHGHLPGDAGVRGHRPSDHGGGNALQARGAGPAARACPTCGSPGLRKVKAGHHQPGRDQPRDEGLSHGGQDGSGSSDREGHIWSWEGLDQDAAARVKGESRSPSEAHVRAELRRMGNQTPSRSPRRASCSPARSDHPKDIAYFARQLAP